MDGIMFEQHLSRKLGTESCNLLAIMCTFSTDKRRVNVDNCITLIQWLLTLIKCIVFRDVHKTLTCKLACNSLQGQRVNSYACGEMLMKHNFNHILILTRQQFLCDTRLLKYWLDYAGSVLEHVNKLRVAYFILVCRLRTSSLERSFPDRSDSRVSKSESTSATVWVLPLTFIWFSKRVISLFSWVISVTSLSSGHATSVLNSCKSFMATSIFESLYRENTLKNWNALRNTTLQVPVSNQWMGSLDRSYFVKAHQHCFQAQKINTVQHRF